MAKIQVRVWKTFRLDVAHNLGEHPSGFAIDGSGGGFFQDFLMPHLQTPFANRFGNHAFEGVDHAFARGVCDFRDEVQINY